MAKRKMKKAGAKKAKKRAARKPARKSVKMKKKAPRKPAKAAKKARKKKPAAKAMTPAMVSKSAARMPAPMPMPSTMVGAAEQRVGTVVHYYTHLSVAVIRLDQGEVQVGDTIHIKGHTTDIKQKVESMEVEHQKISRAMVGQEFGLKVTGHVREHDEVYKVIG